MTKEVDNVTDALITAALDARCNAYAPYSKYPVGAALLVEGGHIINGCNVENASYGLTQCAERTALCTAIAQNFRRVTCCVVVTSDGSAPCGACRQSLAEFSDPGYPMRILCVTPDRKVRMDMWLTDLLPNAFGFGGRES